MVFELKQKTENGANLILKKLDEQYNRLNYSVAVSEHDTFANHNWEIKEQLNRDVHELINNIKAAQSLEHMEISIQKMTNRLNMLSDKITMYEKPIKMVKTTSPFIMNCTDTGGGKTYMTIHAIGKINTNAHLVIVCPLSKILDQDWEESVQSYNEVMHTNLTLTMMNYDKLTKIKHYKSLVEDIESNENTFLILEEAHSIKNPTATKSKKCIELSKLKTVVATIALTATPVSNSYLDTITYLILAGYYPNKTTFLKEHIKMYDEYHQPIIKDHNNNIIREYFINPDYIDAELNSIVIMEDVSKLKPKQIMHQELFSFTHDEQKEYREILKNYRKGYYESIQTARKELFQYISYHNTKKLNKLSDILRTTDKPTILYYTFNRTLDSVKEYLKTNHPDYTIIEMNGHSSAKKQKIQKPENDKSILLVQYQSGAEGWNAQWSDTTVFFEPTYSYELFKQSQGRNVRAYMTTTINHYSFEMTNTLESTVWNTINNKKSFSDDLLLKFLNDTVDTD